MYIFCFPIFTSFSFLVGLAWIMTCIFSETTYLISVTFKQLQAVTSVASSGKFYLLLPDKGNPGAM